MDNQFNIRGSEIRFSLILIIALSLLLLSSFIFGTKVKRNDHSVPTETASSPFPSITLKAKAAYVYDIRTGKVLFAKNENTRLPLASLTKVMSALVAEDSSPLYGTVVISNEALKAEGDSGLYQNEKWSLQNLLDFSLMTSSNDGMRAVALALGALSKSDVTTDEIINDFVGKMNKKAGDLGLKNTYFWNETGLDLPALPNVIGQEQAGESEIKGGAYGTAHDMSTLLEYILKNDPDLFAATRETKTTFQSLDDRSHVATNTNSIAAEIPGLLASKTGFTDTAGGNLIIVFDPELGRPITISILGSTPDGRFEDMRILVNAVMEYIKTNN